MAKNTESEDTTPANGHSPPVMEIKVGGIRAAVWEHQRTDGDRTFTVRSVKLERRFKGADGEWKGSACNLREQDLAGAELLLHKLRDELRLQVVV